MRSIERSRIVTLRAEAERDDRGVVADDPAADDDARCPGATPGTPPSRRPRPPSGFSRKYAPACGASRPAISLIGASSGSAPVVGLDGLVGDGGDAAVDERPRQRLVGGDVEVGEEDEPLAQPRVLGRDRLLHLEQQLGLAPDLVDRRRSARRPRSYCVVREGAARPRRRLDEHLVAALDELARAGRRQRDAVLVGLDLLGDADPHGARHDTASGRGWATLASSRRHASTRSRIPPRGSAR